jgi:Holliday junction resolvasome RuvABC endonuclease subunit
MEGKQQIWIGIDPGDRGAIALVNWPDFAVVHPLHGLAYDELYNRIGEIKRDHDVRFTFVEKIRPMPSWLRGSIATNKLSKHAGAITMALTGHNMNFQEIEPQVWQRALGCPNRSGNKSTSRRRAVELFPEIKVTNEIADALLIAYHCQREARIPELLFHKPAAQRHSRKLWRIQS